MTAQELVAKLELAGYSLSYDRGDLLLKYTGQGRPDPAIVAPLLQELKARKQEALAYLAGEQIADSEPLTTACREDMETFEQEKRRGCQQLRQCGYVLIHSRILQETFAITRKPEDRSLVPGDIVTYTTTEIELLGKSVEAGETVTAGDLRFLHDCKRKFKGQFLVCSGKK